MDSMHSSYGDNVTLDYLVARVGNLGKYKYIQIKSKGQIHIKHNKVFFWTVSLVAPADTLPYMSLAPDI